MPSKPVAVCVAVSALLAGCGGASGTATTDLAPIVERDSVPFDGSAIPDDEVLQRLSDYPMVVIGETHLIREQREFTAAVVEGLHGYGYRQLLLEWPHMADWVVSDYVIDGDSAPGWWNPPTWLYGDLLQEIRDFNRGLPLEDRIELRGIDINLDNYGGAKSFRDSLRGLSQLLPNQGPLEPFLQDEYDTDDSQIAFLETLLAALTSERAALVEVWGRDRYNTVNEMAEIELGSVAVRASWDDDPNESARLREQLMKRLPDAWLADYGHGSVVNVGGNHAQKERLEGTDHEWLGDYLVHASTAPSGSVISVVVFPARVVTDYQTDVGTGRSHIPRPTTSCFDS